MRVKRYFAPLIIYMTKVVRREQIYLGGAGGEYTLVFATLCSQDTVRIMPYRFSMADETVATRPPWLDSSLPRLPCRCISGFLGHNSTVSKQLCYALPRECTRHLRHRAAFAHTSHISWLQYYATSGNIKIFKIRKIKMPESGESNADLRPHKNRRPTLQMPV